MIDKKTETDIKATRSFVEFWDKFHSAYNDTISKGVITEDDEAKFFETKEMMRAKYEHFQNTLEFRYAPHSRLTDPVSDILAVKTVRFISERNLHKMENDWKDSYIFLNNILERLENKKRRLEHFNPLGVLVKRFFERSAHD